MPPREPAPSILVVTPAPAGSRLGNRVTGLRWARILRSLGARVAVAGAWRGEPRDVLIAVHAAKSASSVRAFRAAHPAAPIVVALAGTDLYGPRGLSRAARRSLELATRVIVLQREALRRLPRAARAKAHVILQSAAPHPGRAARADRTWLVVAAAHLRAVKDPLLAARAARRLPAGSRLRIEHFGAVLDPRLEALARRESRDNARWIWRGERSRAALLRALKSARAFVQTSRSEGGSAALAEAIVSGLPVLATRIPASIGMLGAHHPGLFDPGDADALVELLVRLERDPSFRARLARASRRLAPRYRPARERAAWRRLLGELTRRGDGPARSNARAR